MVLSIINPGPNNHYGLDRIPVCTGSGMCRLHCIIVNGNIFFTFSRLFSRVGASLFKTKFKRCLDQTKIIILSLICLNLGLSYIKDVIFGVEAMIVGTIVVGAMIVGAMIVGALIVGAMIVGAMIVGAIIVGTMVVRAMIVGAMRRSR